MRPFLLFAILFSLLSRPLIAEENQIARQGEPSSFEKDAFDRSFALGVYALNWSGSYRGLGVGGRVRWEPFDLLGVDLYSEHLVVEDDLGFRHDHPIGFSLYVPIELFDNFRVRPLFGMCAVFSFTETENAGVESLDDILFGLHAGVGAEFALNSFLSIYLESQLTGYLGHERYNSAGGWTAHVGDNLDGTFIVSNALGFQIHL